MKLITSNCFVISGVSALVGAGWLVHPALGMAVAGFALMSIGVGVERSYHDR